MSLAKVNSFQYLGLLLDFCAEHNISTGIELIRAQQINEAYERLLKSDMK